MNLATVWRWCRKTVAALVTGFFTVSIAAAYHGTENTQQTVQSSIGWTEMTLFYAAPILAVSVFLYPLIHRKLVDRFAGDSVVKPDPEDLRKYAVLAAAAIAIPATVTAALTLGSAVEHSMYLLGVAVIGGAALFTNRRWLRDLLPV